MELAKALADVKAQATIQDAQTGADVKVRASFRDAQTNYVAVESLDAASFPLVINLHELPYLFCYVSPCRLGDFNACVFESTRAELGAGGYLQQTEPSALPVAEDSQLAGAHCGFGAGPVRCPAC